jgi:hypothetical protein
MSAFQDGTNCTPDEAACCAVPPEFVRLRYFFGQRLGVVDLFDEQLYHASKQRFHNLHGHGTGVLCGLAVERYAATGGGAATTLLRVRRGAAIDACGREVVVGWDQCIDLAAWFAKNRTRPDLAPSLGTWGAGDGLASHPLWVALRYRECPSDPAPAPRDPCGCDEGGCEFGRVREGFELAILTEGELARCVAPVFPSSGMPLQPERMLDGSFDGQLRRLLAAAVAAACPEPPADPWLCLARIEVAVAGDPKLSPPTATITDIARVDLGERATLLDTAFLQQAVVALAAAMGEAGLLGDGPRLGGLSFAADGAALASKGTFTLRVDLAADAAGLMGSADFAAGAYFTLERLDQAASPMTWTALTPDAVNYVAADRAFHLHVDTGQAAATAVLYRLAFESKWATPLVDAKSRPLNPARWARQFVLDNTGGTLTLKSVA